MNKNLQEIIKRFPLLVIKSILLFGAYYITAELLNNLLKEFAKDSMLFFWIYALLSNFLFTIAFLIIWGQWKYILLHGFWGIVLKNIFPSLFISYLIFFSIFIDIKSDGGINIFPLLGALTIIYISLCIVFFTGEAKLKGLPAPWLISLLQKAYNNHERKIISTKHGINCQFTFKLHYNNCTTLTWLFIMKDGKQLTLSLDFRLPKKNFYPTIDKHSQDFYRQSKQIEKVSKVLLSHFLPKK